MAGICMIHQSIDREGIGMVLEDKKLIQSKKNDEMKQFGKITENETDMDCFDRPWIYQRNYVTDNESIVNVKSLVHMLHYPVSLYLS